MPYNHTTHPTDVDLVDFVDGRSENVERLAIEEHITLCPSCRVRRQRILGTPPIDSPDPGGFDVPVFQALTIDDADGSTANVGELWLTSADDAAMVLVTKIRPNNWGVVVVPVVFDIEVADSGTLTLDEMASPLGVPIAIYEGLPNSLPTSALRGRVIPKKSGIDLLKITDSDLGVARGLPMDGLADPRHEIRQFITERVTSVDPPAHEAGSVEQLERSERGLALVRAGSDAQVRELQRTLLPRENTTVEQFPTQAPDYLPTGWEGLGVVRSFTERILLVYVEGGLLEDRAAARNLCNGLDGSALAVRASASSQLADIYSQKELWPNHSIQTGDSQDQPIFSGELASALSDYLDTVVSVSELAPSSARGSVPDPKAILNEQVGPALEAQVKAGGRAQKPPRQQGLQSVEGLDSELAEVLHQALSDGFDPAVLTDLADGTRP